MALQQQVDDGIVAVLAGLQQRAGPCAVPGTCIGLGRHQQLHSMHPSGQLQQLTARDPVGAVPLGAKEWKCKVCGRDVSQGVKVGQPEMVGTEADLGVPEGNDSTFHCISSVARGVKGLWLGYPVY